MNYLHFPNERAKHRNYYCEEMKSVLYYCIKLKLLSTPNALLKLEEEFGMKSAALSNVFSETMDEVIENYDYLVTYLKKGFTEGMKEFMRKV